LLESAPISVHRAVDFGELWLNPVDELGARQKTYDQGGCVKGVLHSYHALHPLLWSIANSNSHFGSQPENSPPKAGCFRASKRRVRALRARTLRFEAHTENCSM